MAKRPPKIPGIGPKPRYKVAVRAGDVWLIPGDIHFPIHDPGAVTAMWSWFVAHYAGVQPNGPKYRRGCLLQGDTIDSHSISRFPKKPERLAAFPSLAHEARAARPFLKRAGALENGVIYVPGNHEDWLADLLMNNPGLQGTPGTKWETLTGLDDIDGITWLPYGTWVALGDLVAVCHGDPSDFPKKPHLVTNKYPDQFTIFGHTHRAATHYRTIYDSSGSPATRGAMNVGTLSQVAEYTSDPDHQQAFGVVEFFGNRGNGKPFFRADLRHIVKSKDGRAYVA